MNFFFESFLDSLIVSRLLKNLFLNMFFSTCSVPLRVFAANMLIFNRVLRSTSIYKFRYISGAVLGSYAAGLANNILKSNHLRELLRLENSPLAIEARVILCEKEGKDGPWYKANGPQVS